jgi:hypothetical protein
MTVTYRLTATQRVGRGYGGRRNPWRCLRDPAFQGEVVSRPRQGSSWFRAAASSGWRLRSPAPAKLRWPRASPAFLATEKDHVWARWEGLEEEKKIGRRIPEPLSSDGDGFRRGRRDRFRGRRLEKKNPTKKIQGLYIAPDFVEEGQRKQPNQGVFCLDGTNSYSYQTTDQRMKTTCGSQSRWKKEKKERKT